MKTLINYTVLILTLITLAHCGSISRGDELGGPGTVNRSTNDLRNPGQSNLVLDQIQFDGHVGIEDLWNTHPRLEIHIMDEAEENLLACVGSRQKRILSVMGEAYITYGDLNAIFLEDNEAHLRSDTRVVLRLIEKYDGNSCPDGYVGEAHAEDDHPDRILSSLSLEYGEVTAGTVEFPGYATAYFRTSDEDPRVVERTPPVNGRGIEIDRLRLNNGSIDSGEYSDPEVAFLLYVAGSDTPRACSELFDVDEGGFLYGTLRYRLEESDDTDLFMDELDDQETYRFKLVEVDNGGCQDILEENSVGVSLTVLAASQDIQLDQFLDDVIEFNNDYGYFSLTTR